MHGQFQQELCQATVALHQVCRQPNNESQCEPLIHRSSYLFRELLSGIPQPQLLDHRLTISLLLVKLSLPRQHPVLLHESQTSTHLLAGFVLEQELSHLVPMHHRFDGQLLNICLPHQGLCLFRHLGIVNLHMTANLWLDSGLQPVLVRLPLMPRSVILHEP